MNNFNPNEITYSNQVNNKEKYQSKPRDCLVFPSSLPSNTNFPFYKNNNSQFMDRLFVNNTMKNPISKQTFYNRNKENETIDRPNMKFFDRPLDTRKVKTDLNPNKTRTPLTKVIGSGTSFNNK